jgi:anti-anti-sigma factor
MALRQDRRR